MIKEAIEKILSLAPPDYHRLDDGSVPVFSSKPLQLIKRPGYPTIQATTLTALKSFLEESVERIDLPQSMIHILGADEVVLIGSGSPDGSRDTFVRITLDLGVNFEFGKFYGLQDFIISVQAGFVETVSQVDLLEFLSSIEVGEKGQFEDNGVHQRITVKSGITQIENKQISPRVKLQPYRTFTEVEQPESTFIFRMRSAGGSQAVQCALFDCDGNAWRRVAMTSIAMWMIEEIKFKVPIIW